MCTENELDRRSFLGFGHNWWPKPVAVKCHRMSKQIIFSKSGCLKYYVYQKWAKTNDYCRIGRIPTLPKALHNKGTLFENFKNNESRTVWTATKKFFSDIIFSISSRFCSSRFLIFFPRPEIQKWVGSFSVIFWLFWSTQNVFSL